jgi:hypothetical protein
MSKIAHSAHFENLEKLLTASGSPPLKSELVLTLRGALQENLRATRVAYLKSQTARIELQELTRRKNEHLQQGRELASRLRHALIAMLDPHDERLEQLGIAPRYRSRRAR